MSICENLERIRENIERAKRKSPNPQGEVTLVAVSKYHSTEEAEKVLVCGQMLLAENRVQEFLEKYEVIGDRAKWHIIGHLQHNKVKYITDKVAMVESLESLSLAQELSKRMLECGRVMPCLVQVNVANEENKYGLPLSEAEGFIREVSKLGGIRVMGLMNIAPNYEDKEMVRPEFRQMYKLFIWLKELELPNVEMKYLSMGMSGDYEIAVEEGSNMVRIGSAVFQ